MDWADTPEQAAFRAEVREAFVDGIPSYYRERAARGLDSDWGQDRRSGDPDRENAANSWTDALFEHGWFAPHLPKEYGGAGMSPMEQFIFTQERAAAGAPQVGANGLALLAPTLIVHGTDEQKAQYLPGILNGEKLWAQGYSEPGAGSDLAGLQTRATRDGDEWVINGQKIWTSSAHVADSIFALVRTDPDAPKHRGISFVLIEDIHTPGLSVRPLVNMGWEHGFNETFFEDVRIPAENVLGEVNRGWYVGMTLLDFERSNIAGAISAKRRLDILTDFLHSEQGQSTTHVSPVTAHRDRRPLHRVGRRVQLLVPHHLDAGPWPDPELRGVDDEAVPVGGHAGRGAHGGALLRAVREPVGRGRRALAGAGVLHPPLRAGHPRHDRRG